MRRPKLAKALLAATVILAALVLVGCGAMSAPAPNNRALLPPRYDLNPALDPGWDGFRETKIPASRSATEVVEEAIQRGIAPTLKVSGNSAFVIERIIPVVKASIPGSEGITWESFRPTGDAVAVVRVRNSEQRDSFYVGVNDKKMWVLSPLAPDMGQGAPEIEDSASVLQTTLTYGLNPVTWWIVREANGTAWCTPVHALGNLSQPSFSGQAWRTGRHYSLATLGAPMEVSVP